jgi:3',5'-cyclic AMP phosphodiesterase CpdA
MVEDAKFGAFEDAGMTTVPQASAGGPLRIGHLSDLHLRSAADLPHLDAQLARLDSCGVAHVAITGDLLDSWNPKLLRLALASLERSGFASPDRLTLLHGNHDLSSAGSPMSTAATLAQMRRALDLPPVTSWRRRRFYRELAALHPGHGEPPFIKALPGAELIVLDSVSQPIAPLRVDARSVQATHAIGRVSPATLAWLGALPPPRSGTSRGLLLHHYPLDTAPLEWLQGAIQVPMAIEAASRRRLWTAIRHASIEFVLCGHVHRTRRDRFDGVDIWLQGTSGGAWAGYGSSVYELPGGMRSELREDSRGHIHGRAALAL